MALFEQKGWITRAPGYREVQVTDSGRAALSRLFNLKDSIRRLDHIEPPENVNHSERNA